MTARNSNFNKKSKFSKDRKPYKELRPITAFLENAIYSILYSKFKRYYNSELMLDAFAGTGRFGLFIHHKLGIVKTIFLEKNATSCRNMFSKLQFNNNLKVVCANFFSFIYNQKFDMIILDPPFQYQLTDKLFKFMPKQNYLTSDTLIIMRKSKDDIVDYSKYQNINVVYEYEHGYNQCIFFYIKVF